MSTVPAPCRESLDRATDAVLDALNRADGFRVRIEHYSGLDDCVEPSWKECAEALGMRQRPAAAALYAVADAFRLLGLHPPPRLYGEVSYTWHEAALIVVKRNLQAAARDCRDREAYADAELVERIEDGMHLESKLAVARLAERPADQGPVKRRRTVPPRAVKCFRRVLRSHGPLHHVQLGELAGYEPSTVTQYCSALALEGKLIRSTPDGYEWIGD